jgi:hypothetical protein
VYGELRESGRARASGRLLPRARFEGHGRGAGEGQTGPMPSELPRDEEVMPDACQETTGNTGEHRVPESAAIQGTDTHKIHRIKF